MNPVIFGKNVIYRTGLTKEEVIVRLNNFVQDDIYYSAFLRTNFKKPYNGDISNDSFSIKKSTGTRNPFLPLIKGIYSEDEECTTIYVSMKLSKVVLVFMLLWLGITGFGCMLFICSMITNLNFILLFFLPFGMFLFGLIVPILTCNSEYRKTEKDLLEIFEAEIIK